MIKVIIPLLCSIKLDEVETSEDLATLRKINNLFKRDGYCYVEVTDGDYKGSIAKFTPEQVKEDVIHLARWFNQPSMRVDYYWDGRLFWDGKKNNPMFTASHRSCVVLENYKGGTVLQRIDIKSKGKDLLSCVKLFDIDGKKLAVNDSVLYMNLRYGCGGRLSYGTIKGFKPHVRKNYVSVIIENTENEISEVAYPHMHIFKLSNNNV